MPTRFLIKSSRSVFGGKEMHLIFHDPPTRNELDHTIRSINDCPFGYRVLTGSIDGENTEFTIKIYND